MPTSDDIPTPETEDDHLLEDDGDSFWVMQRFVWGAVKTLLLLGGIGFILWLIWGSGTFDLPVVNWNLSTINTRIKDRLPTKKKPTNTQPPQNKIPVQTKATIHPSSRPLRIKNPVQNHQLSWSAAKWNMWLRSSTTHAHTTNTTNTSSFQPSRNLPVSSQATPEAAIKWLRDAEQFFEVKPLAWVTGTDPVTRENQLDRMIRTIDYLLSRSVRLNTTLATELAVHQQQAAQQQPNITNAEERILREIDRLQGEELAIFLREKIRSENQQFSSETQAWLRSSLLQKIAKYEPPLKNLKLNAQANRQAIIQNIKVTNFDNDPFGRIQR